MTRGPRFVIRALLLLSGVAGEETASAQGAAPPVVDQDCSRLRPNPSYVGSYQSPQGSGFADHARIIGVAIASLHQTQGILDDQQVRIERVRCEAANSKARLDALVLSLTPPAIPKALDPKRAADRTLGGQLQGRPIDQATGQQPWAEVDCSRAQPNPPYTVASPGPRWYTDGSLDHGRVLNGLIDLHRDMTRNLDDFQVRIERVRCAQLNVERQVNAYASRVSVGQPAAPVDRLGCEAPASPSPSYVTQRYTYSTKGALDHGKILTILSLFQFEIQKALDDLQRRIEQIHCQQAKIKTKLAAIARSGDTFKHLGAGNTPRITNPQSQAQEGPSVRHPAIASQPGAKVASPPAALVDQDCAKGQAGGSYVVPFPEWTGGSEDGAHPDMIRVMNGIQVNRATAFDDLRLRLDRLICEQGNIKGRLVALAAR